MIHCSTPNPLPPTYNIYLKKFKTLDSHMRTRAWNKKQRPNSDEIPALYQEERQLEFELSLYVWRCSLVDYFTLDGIHREFIKNDCRLSRHIYSGPGLVVLDHRLRCSLIHWQCVSRWRAEDWRSLVSAEVHRRLILGNLVHRTDDIVYLSVESVQITGAVSFVHPHVVLIEVRYPATAVPHTDMSVNVVIHHSDVTFLCLCVWPVPLYFTTV